MLRNTSAIHRLDGMFLNYNIEYSEMHGCPVDLPDVVNMKNFEVMKLHLATEIEYQRDRIHSAKMNAILSSKKATAPQKFINDCEKEITQFLEEIKIIQYMEDKKIKKLQRLYWRWQKKRVTYKDTSKAKEKFFASLSRAQN